MYKIQRISSYLLMVFNVLLVAVPLLSVIQWLFIETRTADVGAALNFFGLLERMVWTPEGFINVSTVPWTPLLKLIGLSADILGLLPFLLSLWFLKSIFRNYHQGEIFSTTNAIYYRYIGWLFFADALIIKSLSKTLLILAVTFTNPPGHRYISVSFGTPNMMLLFLGMMVIVISWVMLEASKLQDDQKLTI